MAHIFHNHTHPPQHTKPALQLVAYQGLNDPTRAYVWRGVIASSVLFWAAAIYLLAV